MPRESLRPWVMCVGDCFDVCSGGNHVHGHQHVERGLGGNKDPHVDTIIVFATFSHNSLNKHRYPTSPSKWLLSLVRHGCFCVRSSDFLILERLMFPSGDDVYDHQPKSALSWCPRGNVTGRVRDETCGSDHSCCFVPGGIAVRCLERAAGAVSVSLPYRATENVHWKTTESFSFLEAGVVVSCC